MITDPINELKDIAEECNRLRHPFQNIYPIWRGRPLDEVLKEIAYILENKCWDCCGEASDQPAKKD
jgi:hypothetical protein